MPYPVGKSSYPDLRGQMQFVATAVIAAQVASLCYEFDTLVAKDGDRLTVNEGIRSRPRQLLLYSNWIHKVPGATLAAYATAGPPPKYTSSHDESRGSAMDFGITRADGSNRALTQAEFDWLHGRAPERGIRWTGRDFNPREQWHHNGGYPAAVGPIPNVNLPGEPLYDAAPPTTATTQKEEDMPVIIAAVPSNHWYDAAPGFWNMLDNADTAYAATGSNRSNVIVIRDDQLTAVRDYWLRKQTTKYVALVDGPNKDQWFVIGIGVFYRVKPGEDFSDQFGSVQRITDKQFQKLRATTSISA